MTELPQRDRVPFRHVLAIWLFLWFTRVNGPEVTPASVIARKVRVPVENVRRVFAAFELLGKVRVVIIDNDADPENPFVAFRQVPFFSSGDTPKP